MAGKWTVITPRRIPLREVWPHEQYDFSAWVKQNIEVVNEQLGVTIDPETLSPEVASGSFAADLVGTATDQRTDEQVKVIIENQLERTDHDHLGKVLTYAAHHEADYAVWIAGEARPEHVKAVQWLNEHSDLTAFLFSIEAVAVSATEAAPLLRRIVGPSVLTSAVKQTKREDSLDAENQAAFWAVVLARASEVFRDRDMYQRHNPRKGVHVWHAVPNNPANIGWQMWVTAHGSWVCLRVDADSAEAAEHYYQQLLTKRDEINAAFGPGLQWVSTDARARQLRWDTPVPGGYRDEAERWGEAAEQLVAGTRRLVDATLPYVSDLDRYVEVGSDDHEVDSLVASEVFPLA